MARTEDRKINIWINGKEVQNNINSIQAAYKKLINEQSRMTIGSDEYVAHAKKIKELKGHIDQHKRDIGSIATAWQKAKDTIVATGFGVLGGNLITTLTQKIGGFFSSTITGAAKLSDQMADIRKTTGMTMEEVEGLTSKLSQIDTRTSASDLREIAIVAGQLGVAKEDVYGFVDAVDKVTVALGDEFKGGAGEVSEVVGKLRNVFTDIKSDNISDDILKIANSLNELGSDGFATAPVVSDFASRIGGVGITLGLTTGQVLGLSATLQELNVNTERGGTAVVKILQKMTSETGKYASVAGMSVKDFTNLVNTDLYGAFLKVVEGSKRGGDSATALAAIINELEVDGAGASEVFAKLGNNTEMLQQKVDLASKSLQSTDSIMQEFQLKNDNLAGQWEKMKKVVSGFVMSLGKSLAPAMMSVVKGFTNLIEWMKRNADLLIMIGKAAVVAATAFVSYNVAQKLIYLWETKIHKIKLLSVVAEKAHGLITKANTALLYLRLLAYDVYTRKITLATAATEAFNMVSKVNPLVILVTGIMTAVTAFQLFNKESKEVNKRQEEMRKKVEEATAPLIQEKAEVNLLAKEIMSLAEGTQKRKEKIDELQKKYPDFLKNLNTEKVTNEQLSARLKEVNKEYEKKIKLAALQAQGQSIFDEMVKYQSQFNMMESMVASTQAEYDKMKFGSTPGQNDMLPVIKQRLEQQKQGLESIKLQLDIRMKAYQNLMNQIDAINVIQDAESSGRETSITSGAGLGCTVKAEKDKADDIEKIYQRLREKIREIRQGMGMDALSEEEKEIAQNWYKFQELIEQNDQAQNMILAKGSKANKEDFELLERLQKQKDELIELHEAERTAIEEKWAKERAKKREEVEEQIRVILMDDQQKEIHDVTKKYQDLIKLAKQYGIDTVDLYRKMQEEIAAIQKKYDKKADKAWSKTLDEKFDKYKQYATELGNIMSALNDAQTSDEERQIAQLEANNQLRLDMYEAMHNSQHMTDAAYEAKKEALEQELDAKKKQIEKDQAERKKAMAIFSISLNTAEGAVKAVASSPETFGMPFLAFVLATGAAELIAAQKAQYFSGGFTGNNSDDRKEAGVVHANEWVSPAWMVRDSFTGPIIKQLVS